MERVNAARYDILVRSKKTGELIRTECDSYIKMGNLRRYLLRHSDQVEIVVLDPAYCSFMLWDVFTSVLDSGS